MRSARPIRHPSVPSHLEKAKLAKTTRARKQSRATRHGSRHVPSAVKREVWTRDGGQCAFVGTAGRCRESGFLEYHHVVPFADGGDAVTTTIQLRCRAHNAYEAEEWFGATIVRERHTHMQTGSGPEACHIPAVTQSP